MRKIQISFCLALVCSLLTGYILQAQASGLPDSAQFGYGTTLNTATLNIPQAIGAAKTIGLDWVSIEVNWAQAWPDQSQPIDLSAIKAVVQNADSKEINLLVSITTPPAWAMTAEGPSLPHLLVFLNTLQQSFPEQIVAVELFPGANQAQKWGAPSNPSAYAQMIGQAQQAMDEFKVNTGASKAWVIASITPLAAPAAGDMTDLEFLRAMYIAAPDVQLPVIGIHFATLQGDIATSADQNCLCLRHYEQVRQIMLDYQRRRDMIWITSFQWPENILDAEIQAEWTYQAYEHLLAQPFIGAAFFNTLYTASAASQPALTRSDFNLNTAGLKLKELIAIRAASQIEGTPASSETQNKPSFFDLAALFNAIVNYLNNLAAGK